MPEIATLRMTTTSRRSTSGRTPRDHGRAPCSCLTRRSGRRSQASSASRGP